MKTHARVVLAVICLIGITSAAPAQCGARGRWQNEVAHRLRPQCGSVRLQGRWVTCDTVVTALFPLCPRLAQLSYENETAGHGKLVSRFTDEEAQKRGVEIRPLSYFVAEFRGPISEIDWFRRNYPMMLCGFNPALVTNVEASYTSCMTHAREWMNLVDAGRLDELMNDPHVYCPNCCPSPRSR
jgi:hypothetical protein